MIQSESFATLNFEDLRHWTIKSKSFFSMDDSKIEAAYPQAFKVNLRDPKI